MKKLIPVILVCLSLSSFAQTNSDNYNHKPAKKIERCQNAYFDLSTGINSNGGLIGLGADVHIVDEFSINGGAGISSWGYKFYLGGKYYLQPCHRGWAFGGGATFNSGIANYETKMSTLSSGPSYTEAVTLELYPQANIFVSAYKYWDLGRKNNRIYLQLGWSVPVTADKFVQHSGSPLTQASANIMRFISPGGLIVGLGFCFTGNK